MNKRETIEALAKQHMDFLCELLTHTKEARKELAASLELIFELGKTAGGLQTAETIKTNLTEVAN